MVSILGFLKKKEDDEDEGNAVEEAAAKQSTTAAHLPLHEFAPYFCHFNKHTLLTKNGELVQVIKISSNNLGLNYESADGNEHSVREYVRNAIQNAISNKAYAFWIHTLRKRKPIATASHCRNAFAAYTHEQWQKLQRWKYKYYNEIYVTVLHDGQYCKLFDTSTLKNVWLPRYNRSLRNAFLNEAAVELDNAVTAILQTIRQNYNAQRLSIVERRPDPGAPPVFYSEPMEFLGEITNLQLEQFPVSKMNLSKQLTSHQLTFGFNAFESKSNAGTRRFGALMSVKQYHEVTPETADHLLQCPIELVVTQSFNFIPHRRALKQYKEQKVVFEISNDGISSKISGLDDMLKSNRSRSTDFCDQQTLVTVVVDEYRQLEEEVLKVQQSFADMGLIAIREDIKLEECFWAQLPGNFEFVRRKSPISSSKVAGFSRLNLFPGGNEKGNHWGEAVAVIPTTVKTPYFFNFHHRDNGHTLVCDFNSFNDQAGSILLNFLITSALKFEGRLYVFDRQRSTQLLFDKLEGKYHRFALDGDRKYARALAINPFALENSPRNQSFLLAWSTTLLAADFPLTDTRKETLYAAIERLYQMPAENRHLEGFVHLVAAADAELAAGFSDFTGKGKFAHLFSSSPESLDLQSALHAFDMDPILRHTQCTVPVFAYLMHRIITAIDGKPTIIVLHDAFNLLENGFFAPRLESLLEMLQQNNVMLVCVTQHPETATGKASFATFSQHAATRLYVPDDIAIAYTSLVPGLTVHDARTLLRMARQKGDFLLKQQNETVGLRINLEDLEDIKSIFAHDIKTLIAAGGKFASMPAGD
jgi:type IV secretion system protein VirB4